MDLPQTLSALYGSDSILIVALIHRYTDKSETNLKIANEHIYTILMATDQTTGSVSKKFFNNTIL